MTSSRDIVANIPVYEIAVSEFELQLLYNLHFFFNTLWKGMNLFILQLQVK